MAEKIPYIPTLAEQMSGKFMQPQVVNKDQIEQISENLKEQISKSIKDMKVLSKKENSESGHAHFAVPISAIPPQEVNAALDENPKKRGKKATTKVVGQFSISYEVPHICIQNNFDLDNSLLYGESASNTKKDNQFSFIQRLQNWTLQQRERSNGMRDVYYNHMISGSSFRSMKEVVNFMIYEKYPSKPNNQKDEKLEVLEATAASNESLRKEKRKAGDEEI